MKIFLAVVLILSLASLAGAQAIMQANDLTVRVWMAAPELSRGIYLMGFMPA